MLTRERERKKSQQDVFVLIIRETIKEKKDSI